MDITKLEDRVKILEDEQCCKTIFFESLPTTGKRKVLYVNEETGEQFVWNGTAWVGPL